MMRQQNSPITQALASTLFGRIPPLNGLWSNRAGVACRWAGAGSASFSEPQVGCRTQRRVGSLHPNVRQVHQGAGDLGVLGGLDGQVEPPDSFQGSLHHLAGGPGQRDLPADG